MKRILAVLLLVSSSAYADTPSPVEMQIACQRVTLNQSHYTLTEIKTCQQWQRKIIAQSQDEDVKWAKAIVHEMQDQH